MEPFRIQRIESPRPHERTWEVLRVEKRDPEKEREERREQRRKQPPEAPLRRPRSDDDEPPHLVDVQA